MYTICTNVHLHLARDVVADINASRARPSAGRRTSARCDPPASPAFPTPAHRRGVQLHAVEVAQPVSTPHTDANEREISDGVYEGQLLSKACLLLSLVASQTLRKCETKKYTRLTPWCLQAYGSGRTTVKATGSDISVRDQRVRLLSSSMALAAIGKLMGHILCYADFCLFLLAFATMSDLPLGRSDHWRKNIAELAKAGHRVYSIDLLGYGYSDKPNPR